MNNPDKEKTLEHAGPLGPDSGAPVQNNHECYRKQFNKFNAGDKGHSRYGDYGCLMRSSFVVMAIVVMLHMPSFCSRCSAEETYTTEEQALVDLLRLPPAPVSSQWTYSPAFFDALRWDAHGEKVQKRKESLARTDPGKSPEAYADLLRELAILSFNRNKKQEADLYARKAAVLYQGLLGKEPKPARLLYKLGLVQGMYSSGTITRNAAHESFEAAVKADPDYCPPYLELMDGTGPMSLTDRAGQCVQRSVAKEPKKAENYYNSHLYECAAAVIAGLDLRQSFLAVVADYSLVKLLSRMTSDQNINSLRKAVQLEPENATYRASLAGLQSLRISVEWAHQQEVLMLAGKSSAEAFQEASTTTRDKHKNRYVEAEEHFQYVEKNMKDPFPALFMLWSILPMTDGKLDKAEQYMLRAIVLDPHEGSYYQTLLYMVINDSTSGQQDKFKQVADLMEKKCPVKCTADERRIIARIQFGEKNYREAEKQLRLAFIEDPASFPIRTGLAVTLLKMNRVQEGMAELRAAEPFAAKADNDDVAHFSSLTAVLSMLEGDRETAQQRVQKALALNPDDPVANALANK